VHIEWQIRILLCHESAHLSTGHPLFDASAVAEDLEALGALITLAVSARVACELATMSTWELSQAREGA